MRRDDLKNIIRTACTRAATHPEDTARLVATADTAEKIAVGSFYNKDAKCGCPATEAGYCRVVEPTEENGWEDLLWSDDADARVRTFPTMFDSLIPSHLTDRVGPYGGEYIEITD